MSFFTNLRADRLVTEIRSSNDPTGAATQKAVARLKDVGPSAIESVLAALPDADKGSTMAFVEVLAGLVSQKTFPQFMRGLVEGSPRMNCGNVFWLTRPARDRKSTRLNSSHGYISYAVFCLKKKKTH